MNNFDIYNLKDNVSNVELDFSLSESRKDGRKIYIQIYKNERYFETMLLNETELNSFINDLKKVQRRLKNQIDSEN